MTWFSVLSVLLGVAALSLLPLVVLAVIHADGLLESLARARRRARKARRGVLPEPLAPPLEKVAADLRRIDTARRETSLGSLGYTILTTAYDKQLVNGCRALGVDHRLDRLSGLDLDLERVRVEGTLAAAGLVMNASGVEQDIDG